MSELIWLSVRQAADVAQMHPKTLNRALRAGTLHGFQRSTNASWRIHRDCLAAWLQATPCPCAQPSADVVPLQAV